MRYSLLRFCYSCYDYSHFVYICPMAICLNKSCGVEIESNNPKARYCSAKCRVYASRENKRIFDAEEPEYVITKSGGKYRLGKSQAELVKKVLEIEDKEIEEQWNKVYDAPKEIINDDEFRYKPKPKIKGFIDYQIQIKGYKEDYATEDDYIELIKEIKNQPFTDKQKQLLIDSMRY